MRRCIVFLSPNGEYGWKGGASFMAKNLALRGMIYSKFENEAKFADALGWSRQKLNKITTGKKEPDLSEVRDMANVLDASFMDVAHIFLHNESPNGENMEV